MTIVSMTCSHCAPPLEGQRWGFCDECVRAHVLAVAAAVREECARIADGGAPSEIEADPIEWAKWIAGAIRARA